MKQKNLVLMVVAVGCGLVAAFLTTQINAKPKVETVEVLVAAKDLPVGTTLTQAELDKFVETKPMAKDLLPPQFATTKEELVGKRLSRPILKGETFSSGSLVKGPVITLPQGKDLYSLGMSARDAAGGFVGPGSKVDVIGSLQLTNKLETFPLLVDMHVVAVNQAVAYDGNKPHFADMSMVSLAVDQEEALLLSLAEKRGCTMKLLLRHEGKPKDASYDIKKIRKLLEDDRRVAHTTVTEGGRQGDGVVDPTLPPVVPPPVAPVEKPVVVKVWIAKENIPANTTLTSDLLAEKFTQAERPKEYFEEALSDPTPYFAHKALVLGVAKGSPLTYAMIGEQAPKAAPQDLNIVGLPKPAPSDIAKPTTTTTAGIPEFRDVALHFPSGTVVHRFVKVGENWKKYAELTPEQAARGWQQPAAANRPAAQPTPPADQPKAESKID
jgi:Flp pilus assembly protein CpaB